MPVKPRNNTINQAFADSYIIHASEATSSSAHRALRAENIPAGKYHSKLSAINEVSFDGVVIGVDVHYTFTAVGEGTTYYVQQCYLRDSSVAGQLDDLASILASYGLEGQPLSSAVGVEERVTLSYEESKTFGTLSERQKTDRKPRSPFGRKKAGKVRSDISIDDEFEDENVLDDDEEVVEDDEE